MATALRYHHALALMRALALVALATSVALFIDYVSISPSFCGPDSGCSAVRSSGFGYVLGVPVPVFGILGFALLFALTLGTSEFLRSLLRPTAYFAAVVAVVLIGLQAKIGHFCAFCLIVDACAVALGAVGASLDPRKREFTRPPAAPRPADDAAPPPSESPGSAYRAAQRARVEPRAAVDPARETVVLRNPAWIVLAILALLAPYAWSQLKPNPALPPAIARLYQPGKINIVEFADFECPFCRALHPTLKKLVSERPDKVHFVRLNMPLPRHPNAMDAAKGAVCAEEQGKKDEMADALFESEDLSPRGVQRIAATLHLDMPKFQECIVNPNTHARIDREQQILRDAGFQGLPTTYVGDRMIVGAHPEEAAREAVFREAIDDAARGQGGGGVPAWLFALVVAATVGATIRFGRAP